MRNPAAGGAARGRTVPLTRSVQAALTAHLQDRFRSGALAREEPLFRSRHRRPLSRWQINRIVHRLAETGAVLSDAALRDAQSAENLRPAGA